MTPDGSSWLKVGDTTHPLSTSAFTLGNIAQDSSADITIEVDRTDLADSYYTATVPLSSSKASRVTKQVTMYKGSIVENASFQYITLSDANIFAQFDQIPSSRNSTTGSYSFSFSGVPEGEYFIVSGTDMDNDYFICGRGLSCLSPSRNLYSERLRCHRNPYLYGLFRTLGHHCLVQQRCPPKQ